MNTRKSVIIDYGMHRQNGEKNCITFFKLLNVCDRKFLQIIYCRV